MIKSKTSKNVLFRVLKNALAAFFAELKNIFS